VVLASDGLELVQKNTEKINKNCHAANLALNVDDWRKLVEIRLYCVIITQF
jgi:hypothetical protein